MSLRFHEIAEARHRILNPFTHEKLMLLGEICRLRPEMRLLDLACGKGELLSQWSAEHGISGVGVDISKVFLKAARARSAELNITERITFVERDAADYLAQNDEPFDVVSCIGATWIGGGLTGTLELMKPVLRDRNSLLLVGEPFWHERPPADAYSQMGVERDEFVTLSDTLGRIESCGFELVEMVMADRNSWDRYVSAQWLTVRGWLDGHAADPASDALRDWNAQSRRNYLAFQRRYLGWGVFVLMAD